MSQRQEAIVGGYDIKQLVEGDDRDHTVLYQRNIAASMLGFKYSQAAPPPPAASNPVPPPPEVPAPPPSETPADPPSSETPAGPPPSEPPADPPSSETPAGPPPSETPADPPSSETPADPPSSETPAGPPPSEAPAPPPPETPAPPQTSTSSNKSFEWNITEVIRLPWGCRYHESDQIKRKVTCSYAGKVPIKMAEEFAAVKCARWETPQANQKVHFQCDVKDFVLHYLSKYPLRVSNNFCCMWGLEFYCFQGFGLLQQMLDLGACSRPDPSSGRVSCEPTYFHYSMC